VSNYGAAPGTAIRPEKAVAHRDLLWLRASSNGSADEICNQELCSSQRG
jgi:hypothetical protein